MTRRYAENTNVSVARSKAEIEDLLHRYGATGFVTGWNAEGAMVGFEMKDRAIRFLLPLPSQEQFKECRDRWGRTQPRSPEKALQHWEQACRQKWRALLLCIKAKLEGVESGISSFEHEFLAHFVLRNNLTIGDVLIPQLDQVRTAPVGNLLPYLGGESQ